MSAAPAATILNPRPARSAGRTLRARRLKVFVALVGGIAAGGAWLVHETGRPTVMQVAANAQLPLTLDVAGATHTAADGIAAPDWSRWGWTPQGARIDTLPGGRTELTARYTRQGAVVSFSVVSGTANVDDEAQFPFKPTLIERGPSTFELLESQASVRVPWAGSPSSTATVLTVKRHVRGRTVVLTGSPSTQAMREQLRQLALRDLPAQQREHSLN